MFWNRKPSSSHIDYDYANFEAYFTFERRFLPWLAGGITVFQETIILSWVAVFAISTNWYNYSLAPTRPGWVEWTIGAGASMAIAAVAGILISTKIDKDNAEFKKTQFQYVRDAIRFKLRKGLWVNGRKVYRKTRLTLVNFHLRSRKRRQTIGAT